MILGYELKWQVEAQIAALEREKRGAGSVRHLEAIDRELVRFRAELAQMEADGVVDPPDNSGGSKRVATWISNSTTGQAYQGYYE